MRARSIANKVQFAYDDFGQLVTEYQEHGAAVNTGTSLKVEYPYANGSSNTIRMTKMTYPDGRELNYDYGSAGSTDDALSRVASLIDDDGSTHLVDYSYLGRNKFVKTDYPEPDLRYDLAMGAGDDPYDGIDRFGRIVESRWYDYDSSADVDRIKYGYDRAGNRTTIPKPADPTSSFAATYDAWNRLVMLEEGEDTLVEYVYDGAKRRVVKKAYDSGQLDETRHFYYTDPQKWQIIEERLESSGTISATPDRQFVWGLRYIDDLVLRDRDTDSNGSLDERLYTLQDANWNVTALADSSGGVQERYAYSAYGKPRVLTSTFTTRASSSYGTEVLYAGYRYDADARWFHVRNRAYHALLGRWTQRDPLGYHDGVNVYQYAASRPIDERDPSGLFAAGGVGEIGIGVILLVVIIIAGVAYVVWIFAHWLAAILEDLLYWARDICRPRVRIRVRSNCKLIGSGMCNKKKGLKRCTYTCNGNPAEDIPTSCGPGNWDPPCPGADGNPVDF